MIHNYTRALTHFLDVHTIKNIIYTCFTLHNIIVGDAYQN